jgi:hypothetical protein
VYGRVIRIATGGRGSSGTPSQYPGPPVLGEGRPP